MDKKLEIKVDGKSWEFPLLIGTDGKLAIDIQDLYYKTGFITYDPGLYNTANTTCNISIKDPEKGILSYRGYSIEELARHSTFVETSYLLIFGELPGKEDLQKFSRSLSQNSMIHEDMANLFDGFPGKAHPLAILSTMITALSSYIEVDSSDLGASVDQVTKLLGTIRTMAAFSYKKMIGEPFIFPLARLPYAENFLYMLFSTPSSHYVPPEEHIKILNKIWILYAEHEQNVSTAAVEIIGSTQANVFASINAGVTALWGTREGHRNAGALELLEDILHNGIDYREYFDRFKDAEADLYPLGFGHKAYDVTSPRAVLAREMFVDFYKTNPLDDLARLAMEVDEYILNDSHFQKKRFYPNLEFYSGVIFYSLGIPKEMFSVMQAIGKLPGWIAHWREIQRKDKYQYVSPRQIYDGNTNKKYRKMSERD